MPELDLGPAIEAAAKAMFVATRGANMYYNPPSWSEISTSNQESWRYSASKAIEAALPELRKAIAEELAQRIDDHNATLHLGDDVFQDEGKAYLTTAAAIVRGQIGGPDA